MTEFRDDPYYDDPPSGHEQHNNDAFYHDSNHHDEDDVEDVLMDQLPSVEYMRSMHSMHSYRNTTKETLWKKYPRFVLFLLGAIVLCVTIFMSLIVSDVHKSTNSVAQQREQVVRDYLLQEKVVLDPWTISKEQFLSSSSSSSPTPQWKALQWMVHNDRMQLDITLTPDAFVQRFVIAVLFYSVLPATNAGQLVKQQFQLFSNTHECNWNSIWTRPDGSQIPMGILCNNDDHVVTSIVLQTLGLQGTLPPELKSLSSLEILALDVNEIYGNIPILPTSLLHFSMSYNHLEGDSNSIIKNLGFSLQLQTLDLSENFLQGTLPISMTQLTNIEFLSLSGNHFVGRIHPVYAMTRLEELYLEFNAFSGALGNDSFEKQSNLRILDISNNKLTGPLPDALWSLSQLQVIDAHFNALDGHLNIPNATTTSKQQRTYPLTYFDIANNFIDGSIPSTIGIYTRLTHMDVSSNRFDYPLPQDGMMALTNMETLLLSDNSYFGPEPIPEWLQEMPNLKRLSLKLTSRVGTIPDWFTDLVNLETVDLDWNRLEGTLSTNFGQLLSLKHLMLNRNWFTGTIPTEITSLPQLSILLLDNNQLTGSLVDACHLNVIVSDCGESQDFSTPKKVTCPCCTTCCSEDDRACNAQDWLTEIEYLWLNDYQVAEETNRKNDDDASWIYTFASQEDQFVPAN